MTMRGCWSCGSHSACYSDCECAKCIDPLGYSDWRSSDPDRYDAWMEDQQLEYGADCDCPSCGGGGSVHRRTRRNTSQRIASPTPVVSLRLELVALTKGGRMTYEQWARATSSQVSGFSRRANSLVAAGYVSFRDGVYTVTGAGRAAAGDPANQLLLQVV